MVSCVISLPEIYVLFVGNLKRDIEIKLCSQRVVIGQQIICSLLFYEVVD